MLKQKQLKLLHTLCPGQGRRKPPKSGTAKFFQAVKSGTAKGTVGRTTFKSGTANNINMDYVLEMKLYWNKKKWYGHEKQKTKNTVPPLKKWYGQAYVWPY